MNPTPLVKWLGGKTQILDDILEVFPYEIENYYEPFIGGGSVLLAFLKKVAKGEIDLKGTVHASDINRNLIALYRNTQKYPEDLIVELSKLRDNYLECEDREAFYYDTRQNFNNLEDHERNTVMASAMMVFLNKTCFRGMYREGPSGFNVPYGHYKNPAVYSEENIREVSRLIQRVVFEVQSFDESLASAQNENDFVYLDPPYVPENPKSFVSYTAHGFSLTQHENLFDMCLHFRGRFVLSNSNVPMVRERFTAPMYETKELRCRRAINSKKPESTTTEVIIKNY